jgi:hypothetical protein
MMCVDAFDLSTALEIGFTSSPTAGNKLECLSRKSFFQGEVIPLNFFWSTLLNYIWKPDRFSIVSMLAIALKRASFTKGSQYIYS